MSWESLPKFKTDERVVKLLESSGSKNLSALGDSTPRELATKTPFNEDDRMMDMYVHVHIVSPEVGE